MPVDDSQSLPSDHGHRQEAAKSKTSLATGKSRWGMVRAKLSKLCSHTNPIDTRIIYTGGPKGEKVETLNPAAPFDWDHYSLSANLSKYKVKSLDSPPTSASMVMDIFEVELYKVKRLDSPPTSASMIMDLLDTALGSDRNKYNGSWKPELPTHVIKTVVNPETSLDYEKFLPESGLTERLTSRPSETTAPLANYVADCPNIQWEREFICWAVYGVEQTIDHLRDLGVQISERAKGNMTEGAEAVSRRALTHPLTHGGSWTRKHKSILFLEPPFGVRWDQALTFTFHKSKGYQVDYNATAVSKDQVVICTVHECLGFVGTDDFQIASEDRSVTNQDAACNVFPLST